MVRFGWLVDITFYSDKVKMLHLNLLKLKLKSFLIKSFFFCSRYNVRGNFPLEFMVLLAKFIFAGIFRVLVLFALDECDSLKSIFV